MSAKEISLSRAREHLSTLIDQVQQSGNPITITRRGRPAAVLVDCQSLEMPTATQKAWRLRGSGAWLEGPDVEQAISQLRRDTLKKNRRRFDRIGRES